MSSVEVNDGDTPVDENGEPIEEMYNTCAGPVGIDPLTGIEITPDTLTRTEEDTVMASCGGQPANSSTVTLAPGSAGYRGIPNSLDGKRARLTYTNWTGDAAYKKTTRFYEIVQDHGEGNNNTQTTETEIVSYEGMDLQCDRNETLEVPCNEMYPEVAGIENTEGSTQLDLGWFSTEMVAVNVPPLEKFGVIEENFGLDAGGATIGEGRFTITLIEEATPIMISIYIYYN